MDPEERLAIQSLAVAVIQTALREKDNWFFNPPDLENSWLGFWSHAAGIRPRAVQQRAKDFVDFNRTRSFR